MSEWYEKNKKMQFFLCIYLVYSYKKNFYENDKTFFMENLQKISMSANMLMFLFSLPCALF